MQLKLNDSWGTDYYKKPQGTIHVSQQNVNGIPFLPDGLAFGAVSNTVEELFVDVALLVETNLEWQYSDVLKVAQDVSNAACDPA